MMLDDVTPDPGEGAESDPFEAQSRRRCFFWSTRAGLLAQFDGWPRRFVKLGAVCAPSRLAMVDT